MHYVRTFIALILIAQVVQAELITSLGIHSFRNGEVVVSIAGAKQGEMNFTMTFDLPSFKGQTGTGKGSPMKLAPSGWAAQFVAPNKLWIYDGFGKVTLFERTIDPCGFKGSDSAVVPSLLEKAPEALRHFITRSATSEKAPQKK